MTTKKRSLLISGWRFLPHSYAVVNQFQCLELCRRADVTVYFEDRPYFSDKWVPTRGLMSERDEEILASLTPPPTGEDLDAELRIAYPYDMMSPARAERLVVFGTAEYRSVPPAYLAGGVPLGEALSASDNIHIVTPSNWSRDGFVESGAGPDRVTVVPHGVDPRIFHKPSDTERSAARSGLGLQDDEFAFLSLGAMTGNKNPQLVLEGFAAVVREFPRSILILKGLDGLYPSYEMFKAALAAALPGMEMALVLPRIRYIGKSLSFSEVVELYHAADCYVTPYSAEGFNLPALEAAACGLPVICTAGGPTDDFTTEDFATRIRSREVVTDSKDGRLTSLAPDPEHLNELMSGIAGDIAFRARAMEKGPSYVRENFTWKHAVDKLLHVLFP